MHQPERIEGMPFEFVLDELTPLDPVVGRMFGSFSIYVGVKIVLILRERDSSCEDNGVWVATTAEHHESLRREIPSMRSIALFGPGPTGWQIIPVESDSFDDDVLKVCGLIRRGDPRIGKIPAKKRKKAAAKSNISVKTLKKVATKTKPKKVKKKR